MSDRDTSIQSALEAVVYEARYCPDIPTDCCDYGVVSHVTSKEVCRVWDRGDAEKIARLLNAAPSDQQKLANLLTAAVSDIASALMLAGKKGKIAAWTAPYVDALNELDATTHLRAAGERGA